MRLNMTPKQIRELSPEMLNILSYVEDNSRHNGGEAEVYFMKRVRENGKWTAYYGVIEKDPNESAKTNYFAGVWSEKQRDLVGVLFMTKTVEEARAKMKDEMTKYVNKNLVKGKEKAM